MPNKLEYGLIDTNGIKLHVGIAGDRAAPPVFLLHGFPEFSYGWRHQIDPLVAAGYRVIVPDQRGYNLSDKPPGWERYRIAELVGDVIGLFDHFGIGKARLIGHDWGAMAAWHTAILHPDRVEKLGILNVPHPDVMQQFLLGTFKQFRKSWYVYFFQLPGIAEWMLSANNYAGLQSAVEKTGKNGSFTAEDIAEYKKAWSQPGAMTGMLNWYRAAMREGVMSLNARKMIARRVGVPTLMLWGKQDSALSHEMAQPSINLCREGSLIFFPNATHWVQHDEADAVAGHLIEFLKTQS